MGGHRHVRQQDPAGEVGGGEGGDGGAAHRHRPGEAGGGGARRGVAGGVRVNVHRQHRPPPEGRPRLGEQTRPAARVDRRAGRQALEGVEAHGGGGVVAPARTPPRGPAPAPRTPAGAARWRGLRRYQPAICADGGSGHPGPARPAPPAREGGGARARRLRGAARRAHHPGGVRATGWRAPAPRRRRELPRGDADVQAGGQDRRPANLDPVAVTAPSELAPAPAPPSRGRRAAGLDARLAAARGHGAALAARRGGRGRGGAEAGQPRRLRGAELPSALGLLDALPALAEAIRPRAVPAVSG